MQGLARLQKPFKYVVNCILMQNTGAALHSALAEYVSQQCWRMLTYAHDSKRIDDALEAPNEKSSTGSTHKNTSKYQ